MAEAIVRDANLVVDQKAFTQMISSLDKINTSIQSMGSVAENHTEKLTEVKDKLGGVKDKVSEGNEDEKKSSGGLLGFFLGEKHQKDRDRKSAKVLGSWMKSKIWTPIANAGAKAGKGLLALLGSVGLMFFLSFLLKIMSTVDWVKLKDDIILWVEETYDAMIEMFEALETWWDNLDMMKELEKVLTAIKKQIEEWWDESELKKYLDEIGIEIRQFVTWFSAASSAIKLMVHGMPALFIAKKGTLALLDIIAGIGKNMTRMGKWIRDLGSKLDDWLVGRPKVDDPPGKISWLNKAKRFVQSWWDEALAWMDLRAKKFKEWMKWDDAKSILNTAWDDFLTKFRKFHVNTVKRATEFWNTKVVDMAGDGATWIKKWLKLMNANWELFKIAYIELNTGLLGKMNAKWTEWKTASKAGEWIKKWATKMDVDWKLFKIAYIELNTGLLGKMHTKWTNLKLSLGWADESADIASAESKVAKVVKEVGSKGGDGKKAHWLVRLSDGIADMLKPLRVAFTESNLLTKMTGWGKDLMTVMRSMFGTSLDLGGLVIGKALAGTGTLLTAGVPVAAGAVGWLFKTFGWLSGALRIITNLPVVKQLLMVFDFVLGMWDAEELTMTKDPRWQDRLGAGLGGIFRGFFYLFEMIENWDLSPDDIPDSESTGRKAESLGGYLSRFFSLLISLDWSWEAEVEDLGLDRIPHIWSGFLRWISNLTDKMNIIWLKADRAITYDEKKLRILNRKISEATGRTEAYDRMSEGYSAMESSMIQSADKYFTKGETTVEDAKGQVQQMQFLEALTNKNKWISLLGDSYDAKRVEYEQSEIFKQMLYDLGGKSTEAAALLYNNAVNMAPNIISNMTPQYIYQNTGIRTGSLRRAGEDYIARDLVME